MTEFKDKNRKDLMKTLHEKKDSLQAFRFGGAGSKSRDVKEGRNTRKDIARILTELNTQTKALSSKANLEAKIEATAAAVAK